MAKKRKGHKPNPIRSALKKIGSGLATFLKLGPVLVPAIDTARQAIAGDTDVIKNFLYSATGFDTQVNKEDTGKLQEVIIRDIVLVGAGLFTSWVVKHA